MTVDRESLRKFYLKNGYADFRVDLGGRRTVAGSEAFFITFTVEEGERYKFGKIDVRPRSRISIPSRCAAIITTDEGDWYDAGEVEKTIDTLSATGRQLGYAFVEVKPEVEQDREKQRSSA